MAAPVPTQYTVLCYERNMLQKTALTETWDVMFSEYDSWNTALWLFFGFGAILVMVAILFVMLPRLSSGERLRFTTLCPLPSVIARLSLLNEVTQLRYC